MNREEKKRGNGRREGHLRGHNFEDFLPKKAGEAGFKTLLQITCSVS